MDAELDALLAPAAWVANRCRVGQALDRIDDKPTRVKVTAACDNPQVPAVNLHQAFARLIGDAPNTGTIRRHQGRATNADPCTCPKP